MHEEKKCGQINIVITGDNYLRIMNKKYLGRDYYTDVITFDYSDKDVISGDLYISLERVRENGLTYGEGEERELLRVMVHGLLHLAGYEDRKDKEKKIMRDKEEKYLKLFMLSE